MQLSAANYVFFKYHEEKLNNYLCEIKSYNKIYEMTSTSCARISVNNFTVSDDERDSLKTDKSGKHLYYKKYLEDNGISIVKYEQFNRYLQEMCAGSFSLWNNRFTVVIGGFIGSASGYTYTENESALKHNQKWQKVSNNWYYFYND
ncbi:MAG: hypothetical protein EHM58_07250 [Ignavibacteriae bacterium]|nr:MAG: hypothetical protein EHM58_07250 [Ignavibacteriota bacterium]